MGSKRKKGEEMETWVNDFTDKRTGLEEGFGKERGGLIPEPFYGMLLLEKANIPKSERRQIRRNLPKLGYDPDLIEEQLVEVFDDFHKEESTGKSKKKKGASKRAARAAAFQARRAEERHQALKASSQEEGSDSSGPASLRGVATQS